MNYDVIHFEALGEEAEHLRSETDAALEKEFLPKGFKSLITPMTLQDYLAEHPETVLPEIVSIKTHSVLPEGYLQGVKKSILTRSAGYDHVQQFAAAANVASLRDYCVGAVAQTAIKFLYCAAGNLNEYARCAATFERDRVRSFTELGQHLTAAVFGCGKIGHRICELLQANGLRVCAVDLRAGELSHLYGNVTFVSKEEAAANCDVIVNAMNLTRLPESRFYNVGYFDDAFFALVKKPVYFINVTRGEIAPETVLLRQYDAGKLLGIGVDTFSQESAFSEHLKKGTGTDDPVLLAARELLCRAADRTANIYAQPHQAFNSDLAVAAKAAEAIRHLCAWYKNDKKKFDEQLPYYL